MRRESHVRFCEGGGVRLQVRLPLRYSTWGFSTAAALGGWGAFAGRWRGWSFPSPIQCHGGRLGWGCRIFFQRVTNRLQHAIYVAWHLAVPEPDDPISVFTHLRGSPFIIGDIVSVLSAVHLYYQAALMTAEVGDEAFDRVGALEAIAKIAPAQVVPELCFSFGRSLRSSRILTSSETIDEPAAITLALKTAPPS